MMIVKYIYLIFYRIYLSCNLFEKEVLTMLHIPVLLLAIFSLLCIGSVKAVERVWGAQFIHPKVLLFTSMLDKFLTIPAAVILYFTGAPLADIILYAVICYWIFSKVDTCVAIATNKTH